MCYIDADRRGATLNSCTALFSSLSSGQLTTPGEYVVRRYEYRLADAAASKTVNLEVLIYIVLLFLIYVYELICECILLLII